jgi:catechol 2,3-dioxygenase-like lactoylglutathione lyase family enzyme
MTALPDGDPAPGPAPQAAPGSAGGQAIGSLDVVVLDTPDLQRSAGFYTALLGWAVVEVADDWLTIRGAAGTGMAFQWAPDYRPPTWPDGTVPQQSHLDIAVADLDQAERAVLALGATATGLPGTEGATFRVYLDPVGHPFCLCACG